MEDGEPRLRGDIDEIMPGVIADRRHLHMHPELGFQEFETSRFVADRLTAIGVDDIKTGVGKTGVTALIRGTARNGNGKTLLIRADMDALPIDEENDVEYKSQNSGIMHACGHDAHTAMLLAVARLLNERRDQFAGTVKLFFQPAEEGLGGAMAMIRDAALEDPKPDNALGLHIWQHTDLGVVEARDSIAMVGGDGFTITVNGKGGHGAQPHLTIDPITVGAQIITALQTVVSREQSPIMPAVVTIGALHAGNASNVIPETAVMSGTIRSVTEEQRKMLAQRVTEIAEGVGAAMRAQVDVAIKWGVPALVNDPELVKLVRSAASEVVGPENAIEGELKVVSEDMAEVLNRVPGCFYFVGSRNAERGLIYGHHHARFDVDEAALAIGIETMTRSALHYFAQE
ncbi:MAG: M20 family metallopeptidase [Thermomicrobiales bacterium]